MGALFSGVRCYRGAFTCILAFCLLCIAGCGPSLSTPEQVKKFEKAGLFKSESIDSATVGGKQIGPYRVVSGDILEFQVPAVLRVISSDLPEWLRPVPGRKSFEPYLARVSNAGSITLPIVGKLTVAGLTPAEIESSVVSAFYPKYVVNRPMVLCQVSKYQRETQRVFTVLGLVGKPNAFPYPPDVQYNLMEVLAFAGGLDMVADPRYVRIYRQDYSGEIVTATFGIDSKSLANAYSVIIKPGDVIYVDHTLVTRTNKFLSDVFSL